jgi:hypothetical protein
MTRLLTIFSDITQLIEDENITIDDDLLIKIEKQLLVFKKNIQLQDIDKPDLVDGSVKLKRGRKPKYTDEERKSLNNERTKLSYMAKKEADPMFLHKQRVYKRIYRSQTNA